METSNNTNSRTAVIKLRQCRNKTPAAPEQNSSCAGVSQFVAYALGKFYFDFAYVLGKFYFGFAYVLGKFYFGFAYVLGSKLVDGR
ncbi:hypothetical protein [Leyella stercorea]|uniref:hypothetical protein n=1 Tax=Leyella stercorea TaxID=363265 RepID=UPI002666B10C|nr:hypothetical protein [Leyella stercorea]